MHLRDSAVAPFTRIGIVSTVPSEAGVYGIYRGDDCVHIGDTWNLKAHLLELINTVSGVETLSVRYELCAESEAHDRALSLKRELSPGNPHPPNVPLSLSGMTFWSADSAASPDSSAPEL